MSKIEENQIAELIGEASEPEVAEAEAEEAASDVPPSGHEIPMPEIVEAPDEESEA